MYIEWNEELSVGIESIDNQHKSLFDRTNELFKAIQEGKEKIEILNTLNFLELYVIFHFKDEEEYMIKIEFPGYETQHIEHEKFTKELIELRENLEFEDVSSEHIRLTEQKIIDWLINHILILDRQIAVWQRLVLK